jgi:crossover junction endodeoxyribonuclease RusA
VTGEIAGAAMQPEFASGLGLVAPFTLTVYGKAEPAGSKISGMSKSGRRFVRDDNKQSAPWKRVVGQAAGVRMQGRQLLEGPLTMTVRFVVVRPAGHYGKRGLLPSARPHPTVKPDTTKLVRGVEDALTGIVYRDDSQVVHQVATKLYGEPARVEITIHPFDPERDLS